MNKTLVAIVAGIVLLFGSVVYFGAHQADAPEDGRIVLCIGILGNQANTAHLDERVVTLCAKVGVTPENANA